MYTYIYIYIHTSVPSEYGAPAPRAPRRGSGGSGGPPWVRSISEISSCFFGPRPWHIEIRHRVKKTPTISSFGFETLKLKIRRLKLWKPTVVRNDYDYMITSGMRNVRLYDSASLRNYDYDIALRNYDYDYMTTLL